jgi:hypothetical protein
MRIAVVEAGTHPITEAIAMATRFPHCLLLAVAPFAGVFLLPATEAHAANVPVTNCNNDGPGSLRNAASMALDNDVIDLRGLTCTRIVLTSPVFFGQFTIDVQGPGMYRLAIDGRARTSLLRHHITGNGASGRLIRIRDLTLRWGRVDEQEGDAYGGCAYSGGSIEMRRVIVHDCAVIARTGNASGGGVAARRNLRLIDSLVYNNRSSAPSENRQSVAGGASGGWTLLLQRSRVSRNSAAFAGGVSTAELSTIESTVSHNQGGGAYSPFGGIVQSSTFSGNDGIGLEFGRGRVMNSTFSGNAGIGLLGSGGSYWQNTIVYNRVPRDPESGTCLGGMTLSFGQVQMRGNLVAHNTCDGMPLDFWRNPEAQFFIPTSRNLIMYSVGGVPADTLTVDPRIGPLADNGGRTLTHALAPDSPARDVGSSADVGPWDQRGEGFVRRVCGYADIGAYELQCRR